MEFWFSELHSPQVKFDIRVEKQLFSGNSEYQRIDVFESPEFGKFLTLNGSVIFSEQDCFIYNEMVVHVPMSVHPDVKKVLIIGGGDGGVSKELLQYESIETIDMGPFEAMEALGANKFQAFWSACVPQILPVYLSHCLYCFEMNVRASAILGYVGAGGLGITINERIGWRDYNGLGMVLLSLLVVVVIIEFLSEYLRKKLS